MSSGNHAGDQGSVSPLTDQEKVVVDEIKQLLNELELAGAGERCRGDLLHLSWDILKQSSEERLEALRNARDRYIVDVMRYRRVDVGSRLQPAI